MAGRDFLDHVTDLWRSERPELDTAPCAVLDRLLRVSQLVAKRAEAVCREYGLSFWGFAVLTALRRAGPPYRLAPTALYRSGMVTSGAVTKRVDELERDGLVRRVADPDDGRSVLVQLTPKGRRLIDRAVPAYIGMQRQALTTLAPAEQRQLASSLRTLLLELEGPVAPERSRGATTARSAAAR
jgi:DNA-binding MarR family transcriptional regulator